MGDDDKDINVGVWFGWVALALGRERTLLRYPGSSGVGGGTFRDENCTYYAIATGVSLLLLLVHKNDRKLFGCAVTVRFRGY